ncbi:MAG: erythromycin esterase family protein [Saprospiraceae bacterium]|nr:erythromycin esterase family protein [Saprospiraceae bacterium]
MSARDTFMAENIRWLQEMRGAGTRIVVWAHDSHIARSDNPDSRYNYFNGDSMGKYLSNIYGRRYRAYGLFTAGGQYSATVSFTNHKVVPVDAMNAPRGVSTRRCTKLRSRWAVANCSSICSLRWH